MPQDLVAAELCHADLEGTRLFLHCSGGRRVMSCGLRRHLTFTYFIYLMHLLSMSDISYIYIHMYHTYIYIYHVSDISHSIGVGKTIGISIMW